jgi:hypothetical protein
MGFLWKTEAQIKERKETTPSKSQPRVPAEIRLMIWGHGTSTYGPLMGGETAEVVRYGMKYTHQNWPTCDHPRSCKYAKSQDLKL